MFKISYYPNTYIVQPASGHLDQSMVNFVSREDPEDVQGVQSNPPLSQKYLVFMGEILHF